MSEGKAPAWQVRAAARQKQLERVQERVRDKEENFHNRSDLYRIVLALIDGKLSTGSLNMAVTGSLPAIPWPRRKMVYDVLRTANDSFETFQRSPIEGAALWAKLFEWAAAQIAWPHSQALEAQEFDDPMLIFHAAGSMVEVPLE